MEEGQRRGSNPARKLPRLENKKRGSYVGVAPLKKKIKDW